MSFPGVQGRSPCRIFRSLFLKGSDLTHRELGPAVERMYQFLLWLIPAVERFPRSQKFLLGDRIQATALDVQENLLEATYTKARTRPLNAANMGLEKLRMFFRLVRPELYVSALLCIMELAPCDFRGRDV